MRVQLVRVVDLEYVDFGEEEFSQPPVGQVVEELERALSQCAGQYGE
jgi:hypothetical protein